jgi:hypothetical protein
LEKITQGWHDAIKWIDGHPKITLIGICVLAGLGVAGWIA